MTDIPPEQWVEKAHSLAAFYRSKADHARRTAHSATLFDVKSTFFQVALTYDRMALHAEDIAAQLGAGDGDQVFAAFWLSLADAMVADGFEASEESVRRIPT
jgi:hypothetical protein